MGIRDRIRGVGQTIEKVAEAPFTFLRSAVNSLRAGWKNNFENMEYKSELKLLTAELKSDLIKFIKGFQEGLAEDAKANGKALREGVAPGGKPNWYQLQAAKQAREGTIRGGAEQEMQERNPLRFKDGREVTGQNLFSPAGREGMEVGRERQPGVYRTERDGEMLRIEGVNKNTELYNKAKDAQQPLNKPGLDKVLDEAKKKMLTEQQLHRGIGIKPPHEQGIDAQSLTPNR